MAAPLKDIWGSNDHPDCKTNVYRNGERLTSGELLSALSEGSNAIYKLATFERKERVERLAKVFKERCELDCSWALCEQLAETAIAFFDAEKTT